MIELIPAIDIIDGKCVRLSQGDYGKKTIYSESPLDVAKLFADNGIRRLHLVDLDGAKASHVVNLRVLESIANHTNLIIDFGGGIKSDNDLSVVFSCGATMATIGSMAVKDAETVYGWLDKYGCDRFIIGADVKNGKISINGWKEEGDDELLPFINRYVKLGVKNVLCTDISKDGMLQGPSTNLYKEIMSLHPGLHLIASGGVSCVDDLIQLHQAGIPAVVIGKAFYEGRISVRDILDLTAMQ